MKFWLVRKLRHFLQLDKMLMLTDVRVKDASVIVLAMQGKNGIDRVEIIPIKIDNLNQYEQIRQHLQSEFGRIACYEDIHPRNISRRYYGV